MNAFLARNVLQQSAHTAFPCWLCICGNLIFGRINIQDSSASALQQGLSKLGRIGTLLSGLTKGRFRLRLAWSKFKQSCQESATLSMSTNPTAQGNQSLKRPWIARHGLDRTLTQFPGQLTVLTYAAAKESAH